MGKQGTCFLKGAKMSFDTATSTIAYYDENAEAYAAETLATDLSALIDRFYSLLPPAEGDPKVLDLGCGAGRDAKAMMERGFDVDMVDGSPALCRIAEEVAGKPARCMLFEELDEHGTYDGIWSCGALLHVERDALPAILGKCAEALKEDGVLYASFKQGDAEGFRNGRYFTDLSAEAAAALFAGVDELEVIDVSVTADKVGDGRDVSWVNVFARRR